VEEESYVEFVAFESKWGFDYPRTGSLYLLLESIFFRPFNSILEQILIFHFLDYFTRKNIKTKNAIKIDEYITFLQIIFFAN